MMLGIVAEQRKLHKTKGKLPKGLSSGIAYE